MTEGKADQCSRCGASEELDVRLAACVVQTRDKGITSFDDIHSWRIPLCRSCRASAARSFVRGRLRLCLKVLGVSLPVFAVSFALLWVLPEVPFVYTFKAVSKSIVYVLLWGVTIVSLAGLLVSFIYSVVLLTRRATLKLVNWERDLSEKRLDECFEGEAERLLKELELKCYGYKDRIRGCFQLPWQRSAGDSFWMIMSVGRTPEEVEERLSPEWKPVWRKQVVEPSETGSCSRQP